MSDQLLYRQVHPSWIQEGRPSSQTFSPTPKDEGKLSVFDGNQITAVASYEYYTGTQQLQSAGVVALSTVEVESEGRTWAVDGIPIPSHAYIDFNSAPEKQWKKIAQKLKQHASARGWVYQPES